MLLQLEVELKALRSRAQHERRRRRDFRADSVTGQNNEPHDKFQMVLVPM